MRTPRCAGVVGAPAAEYDCAAGCKLSTDTVCGGDGHTYANECLAVCQGVSVAKAGPCSAGERQRPVAGRIG